MIPVTAAALQTALSRLGYAWVGNNVNVIGIRSAEPVDADNPNRAEITRTTNVPDRYNDTIITVVGDTVRVYPATVDPGKTYTMSPLDRDGCAHLMNGQYRYQPGTHKGHPAFVQAASVKIWRDANKDHRRSGSDIVETGWFGINIHAGGIRDEVGPWSAGCQVIWGGWGGAPWTSFHAAVQAGRTKPTFAYTLADIDDLIADLLPAAPPQALSQARLAAIEEVLQGLSLLYDSQQALNLPAEDGVTFAALLNRARNTGLLAGIKVKNRPSAAGLTPEDAAMKGFGLIYTALPAAEIGSTFHSRINQLRHFGRLTAL